MAPGDDRVTSEQVDLPVLDERRLHAVAGAIATLLHDHGPDDVPGLFRPGCGREVECGSTGGPCATG